VYEEPVLKDGVIIVRLWWEQVRADEVAMRARVTVDDALTGSTSAASTVDGIVNAVRAAVERFQAGLPAGTRSRMRGP
jgi:hypothetical protein